MCKEAIIQEMCDLFDGKLLEDIDYGYSYSAVKSICDISEDAKTRGGILPLLRRHPKWNEEKRMIMFDADYTRNINMQAVNDFANWIKREIIADAEKTYGYFSGEYDHVKEKAWRLADFMYSCDGQFLNPTWDERIEDINSLNENYKIRNNMKFCKAVLKICREEGWNKLGGEYISYAGIYGFTDYTDYATKEIYVIPHNEDEARKVNEYAGKQVVDFSNDDYIGKTYIVKAKMCKWFDKKYAELCDETNPLKITRHTVISLNPLDFMLMSNGTSWDSCHDIHGSGGCYSAGTVSYLMDENSFIFYTVHPEYNGDNIELQPKVQRQVFSFKNGTLFQSRLYPQENDYGAEHTYKEIREIVQKIIADCLEVPNLWAAPCRDICTINTYITRGYDACNYPDWESGNSGSNHCVLSRLQTEEGYTSMVLGVEPLCIECGEYHCDTESINCCGNGRYRRCECCGERHYYDDIHWCEDVGEYRCDNCCNYCEDCDEYVAGETYEVHYRSRYGSTYTRYVCESCLENYAYCDECGDYWHIDDIYYIDDETICPNCFDDVTAPCSKCGEVHLKENMRETEDGEWICEDCDGEQGGSVI